MKCHTCGKLMKHKKDIAFGEYRMSGYDCKCGESYFDPGQAEKVLLINKYKKQLAKAKLGRIRSNLIIRVPKDLEIALGLKQGDEVTLKLEKDGLKVMS